MTSVELREWIHYDNSHHSEAAVHAASIIAALFNVFIGGKKRRTAYEFLPDLLPLEWTGPIAIPTTDQLKAKFRSFASRHNARLAPPPATPP